MKQFAFPSHNQSYAHQPFAEIFNFDLTFPQGPIPSAAATIVMHKVNSVPPKGLMPSNVAEHVT